MSQIHEIHSKVFNLLINEHEKNSQFLFTMRKSNRQRRLDKGYWFHGNENYLSVSFWSGMDWMNKTPNIQFRILKDNECSFIFSAKDSNFKLKLGKEKILPLFQSKLGDYGVDSINRGSERVLIFKLGKGDYIKILKNFIDNIKNQIDKLIKDFDDEYDNNEQYSLEFEKKYGDKNDFEVRDDYHSPIDFLNTSEFNKSLKNIKKYQLKNNLKIKKENEFYVKKISINKVGDIRNNLTIEVPSNTSWIFLTGENGSGKTTILRAIAAFFNKEVYPKYSIFNSESTISIDSNITKPNAESIAFAAYGPSRLISTSCDLFLNDDLISKRTNPWYSIFHPDGILYGFEQLQKIYQDYPEKLVDIISFLEEMFNQKDTSSENPNIIDSKDELLPQIAEVNFRDFLSNGTIKYREKDNLNIPYKAYHSFDELASGVRSLLALIADLLIKLIERNLDEPDPSNFKAVVLIDEIDIHFHPSMQKKIVEILSDNFPKVQFFVTTHSPVTLLGAPKHSVIYRVERSVERGIYIERVDDKIYIEELLPNTILTSPIFGMDDITNDNREVGKFVRTEKTFEELKFVDKLGKKIEEFMTDEKEQELIQRFKNRRK
jgi:predicted ATP-binding protein involved in virulence